MQLLSLIFLLTIHAQEPFVWPPVSAEARTVLTELFHATGGPKWVENEGWGTNAHVCEWHGVSCELDYRDGKPISRITGLLLGDNHLVGKLPGGIALLPDLKTIYVYSNHLTGEFPEALLRRWDLNEIHIGASGNSFSNLVTKVRLDYSSTGALCGRGVDVIYAVDIEESGPSRFESVRCTDETETGTHCLVKEGTGGAMGRFTRALHRLGFKEFEPEYTLGGPTHSAFFQTKAVYGDGASKEVETYAALGPIEVWAAQQLFIALLEDTWWKSEFTTEKCSFEK